MTDSKRTRVLTIVGTRPEAIKVAPLVRHLELDPSIESTLCVTAQHRHLLDEVLELFALHPHYDLGLMRTAQRPVDVLSAAVAGIAEVIDGVRPDWVVVQGDTTTALAGALAATYQGCSLAHLEAGLRTYDKLQPFPEESNRRAISVLADLHFAPTESAAENLRLERTDASTIHVTGNTVIDALYMALAQPRPARAHEIVTAAGGRRLLLFTSHRRENFGAKHDEVFAAVRQIARERSDVFVVFPVHPNPAVAEPARAALGDLDNVWLTDPFDYSTMAHVLSVSYLVLTDSGGLQEEAPALGKPVLVVREVTERPEAVTAEVVRLVGTDGQRIVKEALQLLDDDVDYASMSRCMSPYGDGRAATRVVRALKGLQVEPFRFEINATAANQDGGL